MATHQEIAEYARNSLRAFINFTDYPPSGLTIDEIPIKLRCASCNKLAVEAVRLPCCDQNICADCQANKLETTCPICFHEPINAEDCRPNKALRQTIKIFLKRKAIDRDNAKKQEALQKAAANIAAEPVTPQTDTAPLGRHATSDEVRSEQISHGVKQESPSVSAATSGVPQVEQKNQLPAASGDAQKDIPQQSIESPGPQETPRRASTTTLDNGTDGHDKAQDQGGLSEQQQQQQQWNLMQQQIANQGMNGFNVDSSNGFPAMSLSGMGDMNQMMQMMQAGMVNPMMTGMPNMMGMPGMNMDPIAMSQGMFNNFGGPGMMNGMNMGMGFDAGQGAFGGGFNGQSQGAWNAGSQNKFNNNAYGAGNNFGANSGFDAGYNMHQNQGSFNQVHQHQYPQNEFHQRGYHNQGFQRGRGRGRGGHPYTSRGRGNYNQVNQGYDANNASYNQQAPQGPVRRGSPVYTPMNGEKADERSASQKAEEPLRDEFAPGDAEDRAEEEKAANPEPQDAAQPLQTQPNDTVPETSGTTEEEKPQEPLLDAQEEEKEEERPVTTESPLSDPPPTELKQDTVLPVSAVSSTMPPPPSPSIPTGPSRTLTYDSNANGIRPGGGADQVHSRGPAEYRGGANRKGFTRIPNGEVVKAAAILPEKPAPPPVEPVGTGVPGAPTGPKALRQGDSSKPVKQDPGFSIVGRASAARAPADSYAKRNHDEEKRQERRRRHSRKYEEDHEDGAEYKQSSRARDSSVESLKRQSHRHHRDREYEKEKDKASERSSHRSHRHRDRSRNKTRDTEDSYHRSSRHRSRSPDRAQASEAKINGVSKSSRRHRGDKDDEHNESSSSSKRRRSREEYEVDNDVDTEHERRHSHRSKRSRHHHDTDQDSRNGSTSLKKEASMESRIEKPSSRSGGGGGGGGNITIPTGPKKDQHALEREKRDRERQMKELQRRALAGGGSQVSSSSRKNSMSGGGMEERSGGDRGIRINGAAAANRRKISVKYEDELDDLRG
ncbi:uncharacterized protein KY384_003074 [Bacidia gigantensis]|uniref:uncharacterized protein n=1 Tax=Bacidia gigantensis TaxID=2732470 RepID=UPI001D03D413|nr:uncharacterized protein KY384_003074 [Bacidia gigantensis]KAG8531445.1 hypothetical protein KY384_003074 [Bacidia gigantensis]